MKNLQKTIEKKEKIKMFIKESKDTEWTSLGVYEYNEDKKRYEGEIGYITVENISRWIIDDKKLEHLKIESVEENNDTM